jgi:hypothetical protein
MVEGSAGRTCLPPNILDKGLKPTITYQRVPEMTKQFHFAEPRDRRCLLPPSIFAGTNWRNDMMRDLLSHWKIFTMHGATNEIRQCRFLLNPHEKVEAGSLGHSLAMP